MVGDGVRQRHAARAHHQARRAFDHSDILIEPEASYGVSFKERERLFNCPLELADYDRYRTRRVRSLLHARPKRSR